MNNKGDNNGWILTDALITLLLGILVLCNQLVADTAIPMVFGMWVLVSGILRIEAATHINLERKRENFRITMITGVSDGCSWAVWFYQSAGHVSQHCRTDGIFHGDAGNQYH